jgi:hypothetical protein
MAMIRAGVHDPSNPVRMGHYLLLFASAVRWHYYDLHTKTWAYGGKLYQAHKLSAGPARPTDGRYGSHAKGIVIVELDPATGYLKVNSLDQAMPEFTNTQTGNIIFPIISIMLNQVSPLTHSAFS